MNRLTHVAILLASAVGTQAQQGICSCSPTIFNFVLDFSNNDCALDTINGNPGILTAMCFQEEVDAVPGQAASDETMRRLLREDNGEHDESEPHRSLQTTENIVEVVSAQFLEFGIDGDMTVIKQDDTYLTTSLMDGGAMQFYSVSSELDTSIPLEDQLEDPALVPGGASLIMYAKTESGKVVRNRFFWLYEMTNCGRENNPVQVGDQIGWVKVVSVHKTGSIFTRNMHLRTQFNQMLISFSFICMTIILMSIRNPTSEEHGPHSARRYQTDHQLSHQNQTNLHSLLHHLPVNRLFLQLHPQQHQSQLHQ